ncbi:unnamed protein product [Coffea canephora]|uniref:Uncharacterized protein n=1 Tax=Coffea canephora TaxID=49390 RepID=A0A068USQ7_COFCA|nr:unnamed protein product [Coffea canephora]
MPLAMSNTEFLKLGGSVKDRVAMKIIEEYHSMYSSSSGLEKWVVKIEQPIDIFLTIPIASVSLI